MTQFLDTPVDKSLSSYDVWVDIDLSSDVPEGATGAIFRVYNSHTGRLRYALRKNGSTDSRYYYLEAGSQQYALIGLDANRKCEGMADFSTIDFFLVGYTEADATFFTNGVNKSLSPLSTWTDMDLSGNLPAGSVAAIFEAVNTAPAWTREFGLRKNGSTDNRHPVIPGGSRAFMVVGVDGNRKCEGYISAGELDFHLIGYLTMGQAETNAHDRSLGSTGSYIDIDESGDAPSAATGVFGEIIAPDIYKSFGARKNGTSFNYYSKVIRHDFLTAGLDASKKWEGKISVTSVDFFTMGYFVPAAGAKQRSHGYILG
jgi:hypothetical protein